ncbi:MAG: hypothetical protein DRQ24_09450, partial [Candidatus Latescibacterota bacterium]
MEERKVLIIIPTYNEKETINILIEQLKKKHPDFSILVVDDNSPDLTWKKVEELKKKFTDVYLIVRRNKMGLGTAYREGFGFARDRKFDIVIQMDADLSHSPGDIEGVLALLGECDVVVGSRYKGGTRVKNWSIGRLLLSRCANIFASLMTGIPMRD